MKKWMAGLAALLCLALAACAPEEPTALAPVKTGAAVPLAVAIPSAAPSPTPEPIPSPTPEPASTPTPEAADAPKITDPWYRERNERLIGQLVANGACATEAEAERRVLDMAIDPDRPMVALTFDDGPVPGITDAILDTLAQYHVRATFFVCGWRLKTEEARALLRRMAGMGCEIGNHTWSHKMMPEQSRTMMRDAVKRTNARIFEITGVAPRSLRPPGGACNGTVQTVAKSFDMTVALWSQSGDVHEQDPALIAENVRRQIINGRELRDRDIILLHDTKERMIPAVEIIVPWLIEQGYQLVTVDELLHLSPEGYAPGQKYRHG